LKLFHFGWPQAIAASNQFHNLYSALDLFVFNSPKFLPLVLSSIITLPSIFISRKLAVASETPTSQLFGLVAFCDAFFTPIVLLLVRGSLPPF